MPDSGVPSALNVYLSGQPLSATQPEWNISETKKDKDWYLQNVRYYTSFYNRYYGFSGADDFRGNLPPVDRGIQYMLYYLGKQKNIDYNYVTKDTTGNGLQSVWIKGKKVKSIIDYLVGNLKVQFDNKIISATNLSPDAVSKKTKMFDDLWHRYIGAGKRMFDELAQMGINFNPAQGAEIESEEDLNKWMNYNWKDINEKICIDIGRDLEEQNDSDTSYFNCFIDYCAANYCATYWYVENGKVKQKQIPFYSLIWDCVDNDPFNRKGRFSGFYELLTPEEVIYKYQGQLTEGEIKEISKCAEDDTWSSLMSNLNPPFFNWYQNGYGKKLISVVTMFWKGDRDLRYKMAEDSFGNIHYNKLGKNSPKDGQYYIEDMYQSVVIGNKWVPDWGYAKNTVRGKSTFSTPESPIKVLTGDTVFGEGVPPIGVIAQNQDRIDFYKFKIIEMVGRDSGKCYILNGFKLGQTVAGKEILQDFKSMGMTVTAGVSGEANDPESAALRTIETVDLSLDQNVNHYLDLIREEERVMEEAMSVSKVALGQQTNQIGKSVQQNTIAQSTLGTAILYNNFIKWNEVNLQYGVDLAKLVYPANPEGDAAQFLLGDNGVSALQITEEYKNADLRLFMKVKDVIDDTKRQRYLGIAQAMAQNGQMSMSDFIKIDIGESTTELLHEMLASEEKREKAAAEEKAYQMMLMQQSTEASNQAKLQQTTIQQKAETQRSTEKNDTKKFDTLVKADVEKEKASKE